MPTIDDLFPPSDREFFDKAPLIEVVCHLQFPRLLAIEGRPPVEFQEDIRATFPLSDRNQSFPQFAGLPPEVLQLLGHQMAGPSFRFLTEDRKSTVTLTPEFLTFSTSNYTHWKEFRSQLDGPLNSLRKHYNPSFFSQVSLRYQDAIHRKSLGLENRRWSELLKPEILGQFAFPHFESDVQSVAHQIVMKLPGEKGSLSFNHGYANVAGKEGLSYLLDFNFFEGSKTEVADVETTIDHFHELAGRAFRSCIQDILRNTLGPRPFDQHGAVPMRS